MPKYQVNFDVRVNGQITVSDSSNEEAKEIVGGYDIQTIIKRAKHPETAVYAFSVKKADEKPMTKKQSKEEKHHD